ncbi:MAG: riboflavin synthase subunit alpha [Myxococcota bacterium]
MFTGIVQGQAEIVGVEHEEGLARVRVALGPEMSAGLERGASVSLSGVCLTAVDIRDDGVVRFDMIAETMARTTLGALKAGSMVNIERAAKYGDEIGGHAVAGHVTAVGEIVSIERPDHNRVVTIRVAPDQIKYIFHKGYIALDGCSLTVVGVDRGAGTFAVHLIPETLEVTTFGGRELGERINVEVDPQTVAVVDTVEAVLADRLEEMEDRAR